LSHLIHLLPDHIANQIAAGEVIQRPASAVKELLENAVDAGADEIRLFVVDAGKSLIQVIDNGRGMSDTDARMCFERHATSKINAIEDLFSIRTMGFRGEALASIAAVAQVEMRTRRPEDALGTCIELEHSQVKKQEPCACATGTSFSMKNLFFNVPARRNFLRSNASEMRHIVDEFIHVALGFPELLFSLTSNGQQVFHLEKGNLKQRIIQVMGSGYASKLVPVVENTDYLNIQGFTGKPDAAKKTRGDQYLFVNNRYIRSAYLNHAVMNAYQDLMPEGSFPMYTLFIDLDPSQLDINVHPTKQEIKFEDDKIVYAFVNAAVKHALAQYSVAPTLDFELDPGIQQLDAVSKPFTDQQRNEASGSSLFQVFAQKHQAHRVDSNPSFPDWKQAGGKSSFPERPTARAVDASHGFYQEKASGDLPGLQGQASQNHPLHLGEHPVLLQVKKTFICFSTEDGMVLVNQQLAHERILYESMQEAMAGTPLAMQRSLFPAVLHLTPSDAALMEELMPLLKPLGYLVEPFGKDSFVVQGTPSGMGQGNEMHDMEMLLESYKHFNPDLKCPAQEKLVRSLAVKQSIKEGTPLADREMQYLIRDLAACKQPNLSISGQPVYVLMRKEYLERLFRNS
jgi:DNA mismatch repair protein MutL